jgi:hypothetical protein
MRLTTVDLYSPNFTETITFGLRQLDTDSVYMVRGIVGLDAEDIIPKFYGFGLNTKPKFYDMGLKPRDVVMRIVLNPRWELDENYSDIRDTLYRAISATRTGMVTLHFRSGATIVAKLSGFITKFEVPYFVQLPEVQLTIRCDDPIFRAINPVIFKAAEMNALVNPVIVPDSLSTAPHGFSAKIIFTLNSPAFTIQDVPTDPEWKFKVTPDGGFLVGDELYLSTEYTNKYLYMVRGSTTTHLIDKLEPTSIWPVIFPGTNSFHFPELASFDWDNLTYYAAYWGV